VSPVLTCRVPPPRAISAFERFHMQWPVSLKIIAATVFPGMRATHPPVQRRVLISTFGLNPPRWFLPRRPPLFCIQLQLSLHDVMPPASIRGTIYLSMPRCSPMEVPISRTPASFRIEKCGRLPAWRRASLARLPFDHRG